MLITPITNYSYRNNINKYQTYPKFTGKIYEYEDIYTTRSKKEKTPFAYEFEKLLDADKKVKTPFVQSIKKGFVEKIEDKLKNHPEQGIIIGVTGKSAAGKSTLTEKFIEKMNEKGIDVTLINADQYFKDTSHLIKKAGGFPELIASGYEFDAPSNFRLELLADHLVKLANGKTIKTPQYLGDGTGRCPINVFEKKPQKIILVEGLAAHYPIVRDYIDAKVFINVNEKTRKARFIQRAPWRHPDWNMDQIMAQYNETTKAADDHILPQLNKSDIVLNSGADMKHIEKFMDNLGDSILALRKSQSQNVD